MTKAEKILRFIDSKNGVRYSDIIAFIIKISFNREYRWQEDRGYYATALLGSKGLLRNFCEKRDGKWWLIEEIIEPFYYYPNEKDTRMRRIKSIKRKIEMV